ncbi:MAG: Flagellar hook-associated protein 1 [Syntrophus sp. PtaU1.Bin005]|jgi:flagellar hook-associated protein 1 FlgK|nr:MAG: Flagellar hook-associated protein 1 [Syntrophus sp. PtaB.Bin138]OPY81449.1 MAG: Flagellar hook-associated protein 1 [Syntrophus sp. PtaU1.Bin005]
MNSISGSIYSVLSALNTYSAAIDVTSTNIANAESAGYSRQTAVISEKLAADGTGYGVDVSTIKRAYDSFLTAQLRRASQDLGKSNVEVEMFRAIEAVFTDSENTGLSKAMSQFWNAWQGLVNDPSSPTARSVLASSSDTLAKTFNSTSSDLSAISLKMDDGIHETVEEINKLTRQISDTNQKIIAMEASGLSANSVRDHLDSLVQELSSLAEINISTNDAGQINVQMANGKPLVEGTSTWMLSAEKDANTGLLDVTWLDTEGNSIVVTQSVTRGKLAGYLEARNELASYQDQLDALAVSMMDQINTLHQGGYDLYGSSGAAFFSGTGAADMKVQAAILNDPGKIAAASAGGGTGGSANAEAIAELQTSFLMNGTSTYSDYFNAMVGNIGSAVQAAEIDNEGLSNAQTFYTNQCLSVSGVSVDEEMARLVLYQNAYDAAAKLMTVFDEMMQTLIATMD